MSSISLVIATLNRGEDLISLLNQLENLEITPQEIIVIDQSDNYPQKIKTQLAEIIQKSSLKLVYKHIETKSASYARNFGVNIATGEYIIFIDDDVILLSDFFVKYQSLINSDLDFDAIAGKVLGLDEETNFQLPKEFNDKYFGFMFRPMNYGYPLPNSDLGTCNMMIKRSVFLKLNGFDENLKRLEDSDLAYRFLKNDFKSYYEPSISLIHKFTLTGAARNLTINVKPFKNREYWAQYFYYIIKNSGMYRGKTLMFYYLKPNVLVRGYLLRPNSFFDMLKEIYYGYKMAIQKLKKHL